MNNIKLYLISIICTLFMYSCGGKDAENTASPDVNLNESSNGSNYNLTQDSVVEKNMPEIIEDLRMDIKKLKAELDYQHENLSKLEAQTKVFQILLLFTTKKLFSTTAALFLVRLCTRIRM